PPTATEIHPEPPRATHSHRDPPRATHSHPQPPRAKRLQCGWGVANDDSMNETPAVAASKQRKLSTDNLSLRNSARMSKPSP
ncbi:hypothetical protein P7K49_009045, partial [Saguinus oedipus]